MNVRMRVIKRLLLSLGLCAAILVASRTAGVQGAQPSPCAAPERHQFDFWLGNWRVVDAANVFQGTNNVTSEFDGCVVQEHWKGAEGGRGSSFNTYLPGRNVWQQTWVDSHGLTLLLQGGLHEKSMILSGTRIGKKGPITDRVTWTPLPDGRVRQHWQENANDGKGWQDVFDGYYSK